MCIMTIQYVTPPMFRPSLPSFSQSSLKDQLLFLATELSLTLRGKKFCVPFKYLTLFGYTMVTLCQANHEFETYHNPRIMSPTTPPTVRLDLKSACPRPPTSSLHSTHLATSIAPPQSPMKKGCPFGHSYQWLAQLPP